MSDVAPKHERGEQRAHDNRAMPCAIVDFSIRPSRPCRGCRSGSRVRSVDVFQQLRIIVERRSQLDKHRVQMRRRFASHYRVAAVAWQCFRIARIRIGSRHWRCCCRRPNVVGVAERAVPMPERGARNSRDERQADVTNAREVAFAEQCGWVIVAEPGEQPR